MSREIKTIEEFKLEWGSLHGGVKTKGIVGGWLVISYSLARGLKKIGVSANQLTFFGVVFAALSAISSPHWWSAIFLALSLLGDGVDGSLAILGNKSSALGAVYDSVADRLSEALWALVFFRLGAPLTWVVIFWTLASVQEYARARLGAEGVHEVGVITPAERPMRASFLCLAIVACQFSFSHDWVFALIFLVTVLQGLSLAMILNFAFRKLK